MDWPRCSSVVPASISSTVNRLPGSISFRPASAMRKRRMQAAAAAAAARSDPMPWRRVPHLGRTRAGPAARAPGSARRSAPTPCHTRSVLLQQVGMGVGGGWVGGGACRTLVSNGKISTLMWLMTNGCFAAAARRFRRAETRGMARVTAKVAESCGPQQLAGLAARICTSAGARARAHRVHFRLHAGHEADLRRTDRRTPGALQRR
jgi:hypothetical protein